MNGFPPKRTVSKVDLLYYNHKIYGLQAYVCTVQPRKFTG